MKSNNTGMKTNALSRKHGSSVYMGFLGHFGPDLVTIIIETTFRIKYLKTN